MIPENSPYFFFIRTKFLERKFIMMQISVFLRLDGLGRKLFKKNPKSSLIQFFLLRTTHKQAKVEKIHSRNDCEKSK